MSNKTIQLEGRTLAWKKSFSRVSVLADQISQIINSIIQGLLIVLSLAGLISLALNIYQFYSTGQDYLLAQNWNFNLLNIFWWSLLGDLFLYYWWQLEKGERQRVLVKGKVSPVKKKKEIDISRSFSQATIKVLANSFYTALRDGGSAIQPIHIFVSLLKDEEINVILIRLGVAAKKIRETIYQVIKTDGIVTVGGLMNLDELANDVVLQAYMLAYERRQTKVEVPELLAATLQYAPVVKDILLDYGINQEKIDNVISWIRIQRSLKERYERFRYKAGFKPKGSMDRAMTAIATPTLDLFSDDFTTLAKSGYFGLCVAREREIETIYHIIESGGSPLLVGDSGVGVDTVIEGIANALVAEEVPLILQDKRFISLHVSKLVAGTTYDGELEERVMRISQEILRAGNIVLYINNIHNLVGVSTAGRGNVDLADVFTESLIKRGVLLFTSTNPRDYAKYVENSALAGVLTKVDIKEPEENQAIQMLAANVSSVESNNQVFFSYEALEQAVKLSKRYLPDQKLPRKAMEIMNEVGVRVRNKRGSRQLITANDVAELVSEKSSIPVTQVSVDESEKLLNLEKIIHERMVNQEEAVSAVSSALRRARAELRDAKKPIASFLFLGPTGVGKTELARTVAAVYFNNESNMIRLDMSEYQEKSSIGRMLGAPGSDQGGFLTNAVRQKPYAILLLDEIEKASPEILDIFLQVMDDGRLTDVTGRTVDFTNLIIIATSNAGTNYIQDQVTAGVPLEQIKNALLEKELRPYYRPEFLNRFDNIIVFKPLTQEHIEQIATLLLKKEQQRLAEKGIYLEPTKEAILELAHLGFDPKFGARPLKRVIQERVQNALANFLLTGQIDRRDKVIFEAGGQIRIEKAVRY
ncbi:MAG: hypothetical protein COX77_01830 [Candidatus Komeilibacteria bacterium CG_4_10_14_0_2_um_filter_37_10]|uniref:Clp R domain-containing protein n=1 Tax=Candidatus Komeilibacteria bacterium CG_4_10_14_0_2_um_filter_37_10 TaxID=1974470 RepID=A0A2M7VFM6_9BACT|nr:MAG: hypothetical protein COX77_01830 [Candidatus Komeilibacteria bacterium CG_4_10_14_0_2_um_filter_37_10]